MGEEYRLPKEFADKWLTALRSGEYKQGNHYLLDMDCGELRYCCLGIAGSLCNIPANKLEGYGVLDAERYASFNIPTEISGVDSQSLAMTLANMNDKGSTFSEIADWIEQNVELY